jgi:hypothetical protein
MSGDGLINFSDFAAFRTAYDLANGAGAFSLMVAQIPEPGTLALCLMGGAIAFGPSRRRRSVSFACGALLLCILTAGTARAVPLLAVDFDDRETVAAGAEPGNTVAGFQSFTLKGTTASVPYTPESATQGTTTGILGAYSVSLIAFDDGLDENNVTAGLQNGVGAVDDRDRATPVDAGALTYGQIYDDFIFAGASNGPTGGMNITIGGGTLVPNRGYTVSIYSYDSGSGSPTRTANWFDATNTLAPILSTSFLGSVANNPTTNEQYKFSGIVQADAAGVISLQGRSTTPYNANGAANNGVFINALEINDFTGLTLEVNAGSGATRLLNEQGSPITLSYYEVRSSSGALNLAGWNSLDDQEGGDPVGTGWDEAGGSSANILSEGNLQSQLSIAAAGSNSLGNAFSGGGAHDLRFFYADAGETSLRPGFVKYITTGVPGDYNGNGIVDGADYVVWRKTNGQSGAGLAADGNHDNTVNDLDYTYWRSRFGNTSGSGASLGGSVVPEPSLLSLIVIGACITIGRCRQRKVAPR